MPAGDIAIADPRVRPTGLSPDVASARADRPHAPGQRRRAAVRGRQLGAWARGLSAAVFALMLGQPGPAAADAPGAESWTLVEGRRDARIHRWPARCGERPTPGTWRDARYVRRGLALLPVDDAPPVFGPGVCRALVPALDTREVIDSADIDCIAADGSSGRAALRQLNPASLTVVHQVRLTPGEGCIAEVVGTWTLGRADAEAADESEPARPGSRRALAPIPPPAPQPEPVTVPRRTVIEATARALPPPDPPVAGSRLPLFGLAGLLVVIGAIGLVRGGRRGG